MLDKISVKMIGIVVAMALIGSVLLLWSDGPQERTLTAHFSRAVAVYEGTELRVMGVRIGEVTSVVPEGKTVRVEMKYDQRYKLPADAKAAIVTPTLVADRYVQVFPAYSSGEVMADGGNIPESRSQNPVELDRIYRSLDDLSTTLGPRPGETSGPLNNVLTAGANALEGNGARGAETIRNLSSAAAAFNNFKGPLFENVQALAQITDTLARNDATVRRFMKDLTEVSSQLSGEREELRAMLRSLAQVLRIVRNFVRDNRELLVKDVKALTRLMKVIDAERDALALVAQKGALAMGNLAVSFDPVTGTFGSRVQLGPTFERPEQLLCSMIKANTGNNDKGADAACTVIKTLLGNSTSPKPLGDLGGQLPNAPRPGTGGPATSTLPGTGPGPAPSVPDTEADQKAFDQSKQLLGLLGGGR